MLHSRMQRNHLQIDSAPLHCECLIGTKLDIEEYVQVFALDCSVHLLPLPGVVPHLARGTRHLALLKRVTRGPDMSLYSGSAGAGCSRL